MYLMRQMLCPFGCSVLISGSWGITCGGSSSAGLCVSFLLVGFVHCRVVRNALLDIVLLLFRVHSDNNEIVIVICVQYVVSASMGPPGTLRHYTGGRNNRNMNSPGLHEA